MKKTTSWKAIANYYFELARSYFRAHPRASEDKFLDREFPKLLEHLKARRWSDKEIYGVWISSNESIKNGIKAARKSVATVMAKLGTRTVVHFEGTPKADFDEYLGREYSKFKHEKTEEGWKELEIARTWIDALPVIEEAREEALHPRRPWKTQTKPKQFVFRRDKGKIVGGWE